MLKKYSLQEKTFLTLRMLEPRLIYAEVRKLSTNFCPRSANLKGKTLLQTFSTFRYSQQFKMELTHSIQITYFTVRTRILKEFSLFLQFISAVKVLVDGSITSLHFFAAIAFNRLPHQRPFPTFNDRFNTEYRFTRTERCSFSIAFHTLSSLGNS